MVEVAFLRELPGLRGLSEAGLRELAARGGKRQGKDPPVRPYGAANRAEFFAVATEAFFTTPEQLKQKLPELYGELEKFYRQDPASLLLPPSR